MNFYNKNQSSEKIVNWNARFHSQKIDLRVDVSTALDRSFSLAKLISSLFDTNQECFLWIREYGIWPSLENIDLFDYVRSASGCEHQISSVPGQSFESNEGNLLVSYIQLLLLNGWGGVLVGHGNGHRIAFSHDSWISVRTSRRIVQDAVRFSEFGLQSREEMSPEHLVMP